MSGCPEKDIHSVYIDGELPQQYRAEYEAHVAGCAACKALLEQMRGLHQRCAADAESHRADSVYLAQSFDRLQTKLRYSANVQKAGQAQHVFAFSAARWAVSAAAAAAVFAVIFTPVYIKSAAGSQEQALTAIASAELEPLANKRVVVDGNISHTDLSSLAVASAAKAEDSPASGEDSGNSQQPAAQQRIFMNRPDGPEYKMVFRMAQNAFEAGDYGNAVSYAEQAKEQHQPPVERHNAAAGH